ncbi:hypothetical protein Tco_0326933 [Tanacetum coccineum]
MYTFHSQHMFTLMVTDFRLQDEEETGLPPALANIVGTLHTLELKSNLYYEHANYKRFTCWRVVLEEALDESRSSGTLSVIGEPKAGVLVPLTTTPSVSTPSKQGEPKKARSKERHDSNGKLPFAYIYVYHKIQEKKNKDIDVEFCGVCILVSSLGLASPTSNIRRKAYLLKDKQIPSVGVFDEVEFKRISLTGFRSCTSRSHCQSISKQKTQYE